MGPFAVPMALGGPEANCSLQIELSMRLPVLDKIGTKARSKKAHSQQRERTLLRLINDSWACNSTQPATSTLQVSDVLAATAEKNGLNHE